MTQMMSRTREVGQYWFCCSNLLVPLQPDHVTLFPDMKTYTQDGVCLTESGLTHLQALVQPLTSPRKCRR